MRNFRTYDFWKDSMQLAYELSKILKNFPPEERYALCDQLRRASVSIPSNIAEGAGRDSEADFAHFLDISIGSAYEVETQVELAYMYGYISEIQRKDLVDKLRSIQSRISAFRKRVRSPKSKSD